MDVVIRKIQKGDRSDFIRLSMELTQYNKRQHDKFYSDFDQVLQVRKQRVEERFNKLEASTNLVIFMAFAGDEPLGYIRAFTYDQKLHCGCLDEIYIVDEARGRGIGKKLIAAVEEWMAQKGVVRMIVSVYAWNTQTRNFYKEAGFDEYAVSYQKPINGQGDPQ